MSDCSWWRVVHVRLWVRQSPTTTASKLGVLSSGAIIRVACVQEVEGMPWARLADEELNFNFLGVDTNSTGPTPYEVPPSEDDVYFVEVIQRMTRCAEYRLEIRDLQYPFAFLEVYRVGGAAAYQITFSYPSGCDFASKFVYPHDGWVRDETGEEPQKCLGLEFGK